MKQFLINDIDNIKTCGCRIGMRAVNGKLIIQLEWPYYILCSQLAISLPG